MDIKNIDITKTYRTKNNYPVRIYDIDGGGTHPILGAVYDAQKRLWKMRRWTRDGFAVSHEYPIVVDLVQVEDNQLSDYGVYSIGGDI